MSNRMRPKGRVVRRVPTAIQRAVGTTSTPESLGQLPAKYVGKHRWVTIANYSISEAQANAASTGGAISLDGRKIIEFAIGCWDCGADYRAVHDQPCEGAPDVEE